MHNSSLFFKFLLLGSVLLIIFVPSLSQADRKLKIRGCGTELAERIQQAWHLLNYQAINEKSKKKLIACMDKAYLVEHNRYSAKKIVGLLTNSRVTKVRCKQLGSSTNACARRVYLKRQVMNFDFDFIRNNDPKRIASVMAHEIMHNNGLNHDANHIGSKYYYNTVPEQIEKCVLDLKPYPWPGPGKDHYTASDIVGFAIDGENNMNFAWSKDGTVTAGSSNKIHQYRHPYRYSLPQGYSPADIVGMAVDGENNMNFVWFRNGYVSAGSSDDLDRYRKLYRYSLPSGYSPTDIVGMAVDGENNMNFAWFRNGYVSAGSSDDLDRYRKPYRYSLPRGYSPTDIVGMAVDGENNMNFAWFRDGYVSAGSSDDLDRYRQPYKVYTGR